MIEINTLNENEVEILKQKFHDFTIELEKSIIDSGIFKDVTLRENLEYGIHYESKNKEQYSDWQLRIGWYTKWESLNISIPTIRVTKSRFLGIEYISERYSSNFDYRPVYLKEGKHYSFYETSDYHHFIEKLNKHELHINNQELDFIHKINYQISNLINQVKIESIKISNLHTKNIKSSISELDKDNNGEVDLIDSESFNKLLNKHQKLITDIDKNYIQKFVKISIYLKTKKKNTQLIFESIKKTKNEKELIELMNLLKNQIHTFELLVFHSVSMVTSLVESNMIIFYEIYESFDQLGVFNSNWENEVSNKLTDIGEGIKDLMYSINSMENNIVNSLETLTYVTEDSFSELNKSIAYQLNSINSSINFNNLLTGIQTYQMYKINQNTKKIE